MAKTVKIVCLANSIRPGGHCVVGKLLVDGSLGGWIRPVSNNGGISDIDATFQNGQMPKCLDVISVTLGAHEPDGHQVENFKNDKTKYWGFHGTFESSKLLGFLDTPATLWATGYGYKNDRVPVEIAETAGASLYLIRPTSFDIVVMEFGGQKVVKSDVFYNGVHYCCAVKDPVYENKYRSMPAGTYGVRNVLLCMSLSEQFKGSCYKLVAGIISV